MNTEPILSVVFLWHQHQPFYKDPLSNRYELPWVRLHAIKDYYDMAAVLEEFPKIRSNFNLVPSLLTQLDDYATGKAVDKWLELTLKPAKQLSFEDGHFLLENFFMANWDRMIDPYPRYCDLLEKRGRHTTTETLSRAQNYFKETDWRDLQVWFNLSWFDPLWRERDPFIRSLFEKGQKFTEDDKKKLIAKQREICGLVVQKHRELQDKGQIEVTTTPFYHPILPLLCNTDSAKVAMPQVALPQRRFTHPEDAKLQIERAVQDYEKRFGRTPQGMWPSEGSVSPAAAELIANAGVRWIATDEGILAESLGSDYNRDRHLYRSHRYTTAGNKPLNLLFRDHELSDAIGFVYASWNPEDAAANFIERLLAIRKRILQTETETTQPHVVSVILDGENCWEYYESDGLPFLRALYRRLSEQLLLETVRVSDYLERYEGASNVLANVGTGSWIHSNFAIWIGHAEDNRAWDLLHSTRDFLTEFSHSHPELNASSLAMAWEEIYAAEGSDWCWWYGDDHSSASDATFDYLFRKHLMNVYTLLGAPMPEELHLPIKKKIARTAVVPPVDFVNALIDGKVTSYFEWRAAGWYKPEGGGTGTMHKVENILSSLYYGFDLKNLYFRLDFAKPLTAESAGRTLVKLHFLKPSIQFTVDLKQKLLSVEGKPDTAALVAWDKILEIALPLISLPEAPKIELMIGIEVDGQEVERWPTDAVLSFATPTSHTFEENWTV